MFAFYTQTHFTAEANLPGNPLTLPLWVICMYMGYIWVIGGGGWYGGLVAGGARKCLHKKPQTENAHMSTHKYSCNCFSRYAVVDNDHVV